METTKNKLVRDNIPEVLEKKGIKAEFRIEDPGNYFIRLKEKLIEETEEFCDEPSGEELADIIEVIESIKKLKGFENVEDIREAKAKMKGRFDKFIILEKVL